MRDSPGGCAPADLLEHENEELLRDEAEGTRVVYVAATRARDLLVIPAVGDEERPGWIQPLNGAIYPGNGSAAAAGSSGRLPGVQIQRFSIGPARRQRWNEHGFSRSARPQTGFFRPLSSRAARGRMKGVKVLSRLVGSTRAQPRRRGAARYPPAGADRERRRAEYRRIGSYCI